MRLSGQARGENNNNIRLTSYIPFGKVEKKAKLCFWLPGKPIFVVICIYQSWPSVYFFANLNRYLNTILDLILAKYRAHFPPKLLHF